MSRALVPALVLLVLAAAARCQITFAPAVSYPSGDDPAGGLLLDYDLDGDTDVIVAARGDDELVFLPNRGNGTFGPSTTLALGNGSNPEGIAAGDVDGDGHADLLVVLFGQDRVQLVHGNGAGAFVPGATFAVGQEPSMIVAADFNADGHLDAAVNNRASGDMSVLINDARGAFEAAVSYPVGEETRCIAVGDITDDALPDLAVTARDSRRVRVFENAGAGAFVILKDLLLGQILEPQGVALADLDSDAKLDVVTATAGNTLQHSVSVFVQENNGNPWIGPINGATSGFEPRGIVAADFDGDGRVDVATSNSDSNNVSVLKNGGIGIFFAAKTYPAGENPEVPQLLAGDLDADGDVDIVAFNTDDNDVSVLLNGNDNICQQDLGFGGPGDSILQACGDPLAAGGTGVIQLLNAASHTTAFLAVSLTQGAAPFKGGTLVPVPVLVLLTFTTDAAGKFVLPGVPGGGGPLSIYLQCASVDASQPQGFALSNAVKLQLLP
jgi:hypothetical protein